VTGAREDIWVRRRGRRFRWRWSGPSWGMGSRVPQGGAGWALGTHPGWTSRGIDPLRRPDWDGRIIRGATPRVNGNGRCSAHLTGCSSPGPSGR